MPYTLPSDARYLALPDNQPSVDIDCGEKPLVIKVTNGLVNLCGKIDASLFTDILSALDHGAKSLYRDRYILLFDTLLKTAICECLQECDEDEFCMTISQDIIDAICACVSQASNDIQDLIGGIEDERQAQNEKDRFNDTIDKKQPVPQGILSEPIPFATSDTCNNDNAYAVSVRIVDWLHSATLDTIEAIVGVGNVVEYVDEALQGLPVIGGAYTALAGFVDFVSQVDNWGRQNYEASWTQQLQEEMECELFDYLACNNCELTIEGIIQVYGLKLAREVGKNLLNSNLLEVASSLASFVTSTNAFASLTAQLGILVILKSANMIGLQGGAIADFNSEILQALDETNNDWSLECGEPDCPWEYVWVAGDDVSRLRLIDTDNDTVISQAGITVARPNQTTRGEVEFVLYAGTLYTSFEMEYVGEYLDTRNDPPTPVATQTELRVSGTQVSAPGDDTQANIYESVNLTVEQNLVLEDKIFIGEGSFTITKITLRGKGTNPYA